MKALPVEEKQQIGAAISDTICAEFEKAGIGTSYAVERHRELMEANKPVACNIITKGGKDKDQKDADSLTTDFVEVPDWSARAKGLDMYYSVRGAYAAKKLDATIRGDVSLIAQEIKKPRNSGKKPQDVVPKGAKRK